MASDRWPVIGRRVINVGGTGVLPMKKLVSLLEDLGLERPRAYIQIGTAATARNWRTVVKLMEMARDSG